MWCVFVANWKWKLLIVDSFPPAALTWKVISISICCHESLLSWLHFWYVKNRKRKPASSENIYIIQKFPFSAGKPMPEILAKRKMNDSRSQQHFIYSTFEIWIHFSSFKMQSKDSLASTATGTGKITCCCELEAYDAEAPFSQMRRQVKSWSDMLIHS